MVIAKALSFILRVGAFRAASAGLSKEGVRWRLGLSLLSAAL